jgi:hypothetical protein
MWPLSRGPLLKMAIFEDDIYVNKDDVAGSIGPRASSCAEVLTPTLSSVEVIVYNDSL